MSQVYISSSPVRSPRPRPVDVGSPSVTGAARQANVLRCRNIALPLASPTRLQFPSSQTTNTAQNGARDVVTPAAFYTSRDENSPEAQARREDEEHGATQLILLLTLSVVLLTLPWVVDHPVTLLVPVALFILPITSGALRSLVSEGFALISGGFRWFWRHRKAGRAYATVPQAPAVSTQRSPQPAPSPAFTQNGQLSRAWQPSGIFHTSQQPESWQYSGARGISDQHMRVVATGTQPGNAPTTCSRVGGAMPQQPVWQALPQRPHPAVQAVVRQPPSAAPELTTPDLDFDSDGEGPRPADVRGRTIFVQGPFAAQVQAMGAADRCGQQQAQQSSNSSSGAQHNASQPRQQRPPSRGRATDQAAECTVYNWDAADECTQRRGHRPLSDLLNNVQ